MKSLILVLCLALTGLLYAQEVQFNNFKINDLEYAKESLAPEVDSKSFTGTTTLGLGTDWTEDNPLYQEILKEFQTRYIELGKAQTDKLITLNGLSTIGQYNNVGVSFKKPFANFSVDINRRVTPYLFDERWIVNDEFTISIEASKLLSNLKEQGALDINETQYAAFAGVTFKRVYRFSHLANSYLEGLTTHFDKLFLPFLKFRRNAIATMDPYDVIEREDYLSAAAGGAVNIPVASAYGSVNVSVQAGVLVRLSRLSHIWIQALGTDELSEPAERVRISSEKTLSFETGASLGVQVDFLKLLRLTLLSADISYSYAEAFKTNLSFREQDMSHLTGEGEIGHEMKVVLRGGQGKPEVLAPFLVSEESRKAQMSSSRFLFLIFGSKKVSDTQQTQVVKNGVLTTYFTHDFLKIRYVNNPLSSLLSSLLKSILHLDMTAAQITSETKKVHIEYKNEKDLLKDKGILDASQNEKLSLLFETTVYAAKTKGWWHRKMRKLAIAKLETYSGLSQDVLNMVKEQQLVGPMEIHQQIVLDQEGVRQFHNVDREEFVDFATGICEQGNYIVENCVEELAGKYDNYRESLEWAPVTAEMKETCGWEKQYDKFFGSLFHSKERKKAKACIDSLRKRSVDQMMAAIPVWKLKNLVLSIYAITDKKDHFDRLFGEKNIFLYGDFMAKTLGGQDFLTNFKDGVFQGLGVSETDSHIGRAIASVE